MSNYIYEMDVARLRIQYLLPDGWVCYQVSTTLRNVKPHDGSDIFMEYDAWCGRDQENKALHEFKSFTDQSLQRVVEKVRVWSIERTHQQQPVDKSPEDGTDSVITA